MAVRRDGTILIKKVKRIVEVSKARISWKLTV
jgi:hypothetical protein